MYVLGGGDDPHASEMLCGNVNFNKAQVNVQRPSVSNAFFLCTRPCTFAGTPFFKFITHQLAQELALTFLSVNYIGIHKNNFFVFFPDYLYRNLHHLASFG